jgi:hypothetical protein
MRMGICTVCILLPSGGLCWGEYGANSIPELTLSQTVEISGTEVTVKGVSDKFKTVSDGVTGKGFSAKDVIVEVSTAVA